MAGKKIVLVVASNGYQNVEYGDTRRELEKTGFSVLTASDKSGQAVAADKSTTKIDVQLSLLKTSDFDAIFFIGGAGALFCLDNPISYQILTSAATNKKVFGAICISSRILAKSGVLKGRKATGWDGDQKLAGILKEYGVIYEKKDVVVDGKIVTATGPAVSSDFAKAIISVMK